jgi:hypothetical protein
MSDAATHTAQKAIPERQRALLTIAVQAAIARASDEKLGKGAYDSLAERMSRLVETSQVRTLESIAFTTDKVSDVTDLIKRSIGRDRKGRGWATEDLGRDLLIALQALRAEAERIVKDLPDALSGAVDADLPRRVHLELCRELIKHVAAEFLFRK